MPEPTLSFKCLGHTERVDGTIANYSIEVTSSSNGRVEVLEVEPNHLISARSMKRFLLNRCMFYSTTQKKHTETIAAMFVAQDAEAEREENSLD
ncbi:hypothetical protein K8374_10040 [Pseudomonas sp. p1(2021b)]|uniref:hypothetical protein n=1 Tax=Pseudomonas sp. p1(2021b) TaxID=2874628 RepID=UPI001CCD7B88|nr:hypothetical protein [Pseudomonas sp. p1(2021b)]UBM27262.1 hypothetical protein K8374_10040 [Pseudomonas sp. p1(2021b)]